MPQPAATRNRRRLTAATGAVVFAGQRYVLTTGVMIALALIASITIVGMALAVGDFSLAAAGLQPASTN